MKLRIETAGLDQLALEMDVLARETRPTLAKVLNDFGPNIRKATIAAETHQTNLSSSTITRAQKQKRADAGSLTYEITSEGGDIRAKFFSPREGQGGVIAFPRGNATLYPGSFLMGGRFKRVPINKFGGNVMRRVGPMRGPLRVVKTNVSIPEEMTKGETLVAFERASVAIVDAAVKRLAALLK